MDERFDVALINLVKKYTMLFNVNAKGYKNVEKKNRIWNAIGKRLNTTGEICLKRWTTMRNCYRQNVERSKKRGRPPTWVYFKLMNFLENYPNPKKVKIFASQSSKNDYDELSNDTEMAENMDEDELCWRLIEEVKKREELYNKKSPIYYDTAKRGETWKEIARCLDKSENACRDKWRSLRDIYIKLRKRNMLNRKADCRNRRWKYYEEMQFLDNFITLNTLKLKNTNNLTEGMNIGDETENSPIEYDSQSENNSCDLQKKEFTKEDNFQLIKLVKVEPILYSKKWANRSHIFRKRKWENIAKTLQTNVKTCKERWRSLRDQYIKLKKKQNQNDSDLSWLYFNDLTFLNEHIGGRAAETIISNNEESAEIQENLNESNAELKTEMLTEYTYDEENPDENLQYEFEKSERHSLSSNELITFEADAFMTTSAEEDWPNGIEYKSESVKNELSQESLDEQFIEEETEYNYDDDEPILYLQSNSQEDEESSNSSLSLSLSNRLTDKKNVLASIKELMEAHKQQQCSNCQEQQKDSTTLLFESLAVSIKNSQLSECEVLELQADIHSFVIQKLVEYNNRRKADNL